MNARLVELAPSMETAVKWSRLTEDWTDEQMHCLVTYLRLEENLERVTRTAIEGVRSGRNYIRFYTRADGSTGYIASDTSFHGPSSYRFNHDALQWAENALYRAIDEGFLDVTREDLDQFLFMYNMGAPHPLAIAMGSGEEGS